MGWGGKGSRGEGGGGVGGIPGEGEMDGGGAQHSTVCCEYPRMGRRTEGVHSTSTACCWSRTARGRSVGSAQCMGHDALGFSTLGRGERQS